MLPILSHKIGLKNESTETNPATTTTSVVPTTSTDETSKGLYDPDSLDDVPRPKLKSRGWTLGNSGSLVEGSEDESPWVAIGWVVIPSGIAALLLAAMLYG